MICNIQSISKSNKLTNSIANDSWFALGSIVVSSVLSLDHDRQILIWMMWCDAMNETDCREQ